MALRVSSSTSDGTAIIAMEGELDAATAPELQGNLDRAVAPGTARLVLDMRKLDYLSSAGLRQLIYARQNMDDGVRVVLVGANERVRQTIEWVGFDQSVTFTDRIPE